MSKEQAAIEKPSGRTKFIRLFRGASLATFVVALFGNFITMPMRHSGGGLMWQSFAHCYVYDISYQFQIDLSLFLLVVFYVAAYWLLFRLNLALATKHVGIQSLPLFVTAALSALFYIQNPSRIDFFATKTTTVTPMITTLAVGLIAYIVATRIGDDRARTRVLTISLYGIIFWIGFVGTSCPSFF